MSPFASHLWVPTLRSRLLLSAVVAGFLVVTLIPPFCVAASGTDSIPQLGPRDVGWNANFWDFQLDPPPGSAHGPMKTDPRYPYVSQCQNGGWTERLRRRGGGVVEGCGLVYLLGCRDQAPGV